MLRWIQLHNLAKYGKIYPGVEIYGRRLAPPSQEGTSCPLRREGVVLMLTYSELFQFCLVIIGIIGLFLQAKKK